MVRPKRPSFVISLPLPMSPAQARLIEDTFLVATRLHNVMVQHGRVIFDRLKQDPDWQRARDMPTTTAEERVARRKLFRELRERHGFRDYDFQGEVVRHKNAGFRGRIGSNMAQKIATKVFLAFEQVLFNARGKPRFRTAHRPLRSIEEKSKDTGLRLTGDATAVTFRGMQVPLKLPDEASDPWLFEALQAPTRYCRLLRRKGRYGWMYTLQIIKGGYPPQKPRHVANRAADGSVGGWDLGPSRIAMVTDTHAALIPFCASIDPLDRELRRLQRKLDRQRRANNPDRFDAKGRIRPGGGRWVSSRRMRATEARISRLLRRLAKARQTDQGRLANRFMEFATTWRDDGVSLKWLQSMYGRSIKTKAPGQFVAAITRKAERAGASRDRQSARVLKTSQYDHSRDCNTPKKLSERWHDFADGRGRVQRDIYSAFLARNAVRVPSDNPETGWRHDPVVLERAWQDLAPGLEECGLFVRDRGRHLPSAPPDQG